MAQKELRQQAAKQSNGNEAIIIIVLWRIPVPRSVLRQFPLSGSQPHPHFPGLVIVSI